MASRADRPEIKGRFPSGRPYATPGAIALAERERIDLAIYFERHLAGDWSDMDGDDQRANEEALLRGGRIFSGFNLPGGSRRWIITEADRSSTTLLLPEEY